jgi:hypothetical protein
MTSEPDNKSGRRPPTIDLKATEVDKPAAETAQPAGERTANADAASPKAGGRSAGRLKSHALSAGIGALATAAIIVLLWMKGLIPLSEPMTPMTPPMAPPGPAASGATATPAATAAPDNKVPAAAETKPAETKSLADSLTALSHRVDDIAATSQGAVKSADAAQAAADAAKTAAQSNVQKSDIDALANRIAALESAVKTLSDNAAHPQSGADDQAARLTIAAEALRAAVERGSPYQGELAAVQALGVDQSATAALAAFATSGVPSAAALAHELAGLTPALAQASATPSGENSFLGRLEDNAQKLVRITPVDAPAGNDPSSVIARITIDAAREDITAALTDIAALPDPAKSLAADWVKKAEARNAAIAASRQIAADALAGLSKPAAQ